MLKKKLCRLYFMSLTEAPPINIQGSLRFSKIAIPIDLQFIFLGVKLSTIDIYNTHTKCRTSIYTCIYVHRALDEKQYVSISQALTPTYLISKLVIDILQGTLIHKPAIKKSFHLQP